jgi:alkylation response protein AidB-like acyl-CoA dehydrogenase
VDIQLSDEQRFLQETVRKFLDYAAPLSIIKQRAAAGEPPLARSYWSRAAELGVAAMLVPEEYGGAGSEQPVLDLVVVAEEMGRHIAPGPLLPTSVVADTLAQVGTHGQKEYYLPLLAEGSLLATWALAEAPDKWEPAQVSTRARRVDENWVLRGEKSTVEAADVADLFLVTARADDGIGQFLVPRDSPGLTVKVLPQYDLGRLFGDVTFSEVRVPAQAAVGQPGAIDKHLERQYELALTLQAAETVGLLDRIFDLTLDFVRNRYTFGRPLASYQALKHRIADHKLWLEAALGLSTALANVLASGGEGSAQLASATKAHIGDQSVTIISDCGQMFGGIAMTWDHDLHVYLRRATANKFLYGSPTQHRERLCRLIGL